MDFTTEARRFLLGRQENRKKRYLRKVGKEERETNRASIGTRLFLRIEKPEKKATR
jgi:hypothetical protein